MLKGRPATEQCIIIENVGFLNNADLDGKALPPSGAPNIMMAAGGTQLDKILEADTIDVWQFHVDWKDPSKTKVTGPEKIKVAPYHLPVRRSAHQLRAAAGHGPPARRAGRQDHVAAGLPQGGEPRVDRGGPFGEHLQGGRGGVRWYEFRVEKDRKVSLYQQGTYCADGLFRWLPSPAIDRLGNIGIGYSFGSGSHPRRAAFRRAARRRSAWIADAGGNGARRRRGRRRRTRCDGRTTRTTAVDPSDDCTIWYVGDYIKKDAPSYSTKIGAFRMAGCQGVK